jgi:opacity protein-like surface antigen
MDRLLPVFCGVVARTSAAWAADGAVGGPCGSRARSVGPDRQRSPLFLAGARPLKQLLLAGVALILIGGPASAADVPLRMPAKAPPEIATPTKFTWTGCYIGGHVGGGWGRKDLSNPTGFALSDGSPLFTGTSLSLDQPISGLLGGGQAGCKYQVAPRWVVGIDGDFSAAHLVGTNELTLNPFAVAPGVEVPTMFRAKTDWLASATANLGYASNRLLLYAKGGAAWAHDKYALTTPSVFTGFTTVAPADFEGRETRTGWTAGAGIEYAFWNHFSAKLEYDYYGFGKRNVHFVDQLSPTGSAGDVDIKQHIHAIKFGINYYFWDVAAPAAENPSGLVTKAPAPASAWTTTLNSEARYFSWQSNRGTPTSVAPTSGGGRGAELYIPYALQLVGRPSEDFKIELLGRGGWVWARQSTAGLTGEVATATDTVASGTVTYLGLNGFQPFASVNLNLPTGQSALFGPAANARMDPDMVDIASFGEGFNIGPTLGFNLPVSSSLIFTTSVGYTRRGGYLREGTLSPIPGSPPPTIQTPTNVEPGDALTVTQSVGFQVGQLSGKITGSVSDSRPTVENGVPLYKAGRRFLATGTWSYNWTDVGVTTLTAAASHANRNKVEFAAMPAVLVTEMTNTNSNLYRVGLQHLFPLTQQFWAGPLGSFLFRDHNGYDQTTLQFVPAKERWSAGVLARYAASENLTLNARAEHVWTHENVNPAPKVDAFNGFLPIITDTVPVVSSSGWQFVVGALAKF